MSSVRKKSGKKSPLFSIISVTSPRHVPSKVPICKLKGWTPISVDMHTGITLVTWGNLGEISLSQPFFWRSLAQLDRKSSELIISGVDAVEALHANYPGMVPSGFIFHISHCGSTLLSNVLGAIPQNLAISEPRPLDTVMRAGTVPEKKRIRWFRAMTSALGQKRLGIEKNYFIKFNSWALLSYPFIKTAFPSTPWVCMYRHPLEVIVSQLKRQSLLLRFINEKPFTNLGIKKRVTISLVEATARTLGRYYEIYLAMAGPSVLMVNYNQLSDQTYARILQHFGLTVNEEEWKAMLAESQIYSKSNDHKRIFRSDSAEKQQWASPYIRRMTETWAMESYRRLEDYRMSGKLSRPRTLVSNLVPRGTSRGGRVRRFV